MSVLRKQKKTTLFTMLVIWVFDLRCMITSYSYYLLDGVGRRLEALNVKFTKLILQTGSLPTV